MLEEIEVKDNKKYWHQLTDVFLFIYINKPDGNMKNV